MKRTRRMEITVETDELLMIQGTRPAQRLWCKACAEPLLLVGIDEAVAVSSTSARVIFQLVEAGAIHHLETSEGFLLICLKSLAETLRPATHPKLVGGTNGGCER